MNKLGILHTHYIPLTLKNTIDEINAIVVPEFYPELIYSYYGEIKFFNNFKDSIYWINQNKSLQEHYLFSLENIKILKDIDLLDELKKEDVMSIQIYHNQSNQFFDGTKGITDEGFRLLKKIKELDMYLDLSHLNDVQANNILDNYSGKVMVSHCSCLDLLEQKECRSNALHLETLEKIVKRDGLIGICFVNNIIARKSDMNNKRSVWLDIVHQLTILIENLGSYHLALGPDFFDMDYFSKIYHQPLFIPDELYSEEGYNQLAKELIASGIGEHDLENLLYLNVNRLF